jgi:LuxR family maltose regulon positive regulatory protein
MNNLEILVEAKCCYEEKRYTETLDILSARNTHNDLEDFLLGKLEMTTLRAVSWHRLGEAERAFRELETAYNVYRPNSLSMPFVELGESMADLIQDCLEENTTVIPRPWLEMIRGKASAYAKKCSLYAEYRREGENPGDDNSALTLRELEVLNALSQGLTREDIADTSKISINAVKSAIKSVYTKLGARNRADVVRIATARKLLKNIIF